MKIIIEVNTADKVEVAEVMAFMGTFLTTTDGVEVKSTARKPRTVAKKPVEKKEVAEVEAKEKEAEEATETKPSGITLQAVKDRAKEKVAEVGREAVKKCIAEFGEKLTDVTEADYGKLYKKLGAL